MKSNMKLVELFGLTWNPAYDEDSEPGADPDPDPGTDPGADPDPDPVPKADSASGKKTFSQEEVNSILAKEKRIQQSQTQKAIDELQALKKKASITAEERQDLDKRIESLQNDLMTKEQLAKKQSEKDRKRHQGEIEQLSAERDSWKSRFTDSTIKRSITDAAAENKAFHPQHIVALLQPNTQLIEVLNSDGDPTGQYEAKVNFADTDEKGKPVQLSLTVTEAVKKMREMEEHLNLFQGDGAGGLGSQNRGKSGKEKTLSDAAKEGPEAYRKAREAQGLK